MQDKAETQAPIEAASPKGTGRAGALAREIERRRTFAIISHPDAGKTTLTEKLLLFGGAIQLAGQVKAKKDGRSTRSDWMAIEKARGISVVTSVMTFEYGGTVFNLLDTPGHEDFSDHTYRTLTAVDSAIMVIDAAKGIEARTRKLFEICRLRDIPIITFINKMDRETREPLELLDEIEKTLALDTAPMVWPVGRGRDFKGTYDLLSPRLRQLDEDAEGQPLSGPDDPIIDTLMEPDAAAHWREEIGLVSEACGKFDMEAFRQGTLTPVYFGSALRNYGVRALIDALIAYGTRESSSFRALVDSLDASDLLVFVESSRRLEGHLAGKLRFVSTIARFRVVSIVIDGTLSPARRVAALAHELQHACEVAADSEVRSEAALGRLYGRIGRHRRASDVYETERAIQVGQQVLKEVSGRGSIESALTASRPTPAPAVTSEP